MINKKIEMPGSRTLALKSERTASFSPSIIGRNYGMNLKKTYLDVLFLDFFN
jgi:hypothetical protein